LRLAVPRGSRAAALGLLAGAFAAYAWLPGFGAGVDAAISALSASDPRGPVQALRAYLLGFGAWAPLVSAALMVLQAIIAPLPAFVITFTNGLLFGWAWGAALSWSSAMAGAALCFWIARALGRPAVERLVGVTALDRADRFFVRHGARAILVARLLPFVPFDPISYGAGLTATRFWPFLLATGVGQLPATLLYSWLGERAAGSVRLLLWGFSAVAALAVLGWGWRGALGRAPGREGPGRRPLAAAPPGGPPP
jgi:uncharacterized membrane protein YdjX (TVP38/TMEM64 family)